MFIVRTVTHPKSEFKRRRRMTTTRETFWKETCFRVPQNPRHLISSFKVNSKQISESRRTNLLSIATDLKLRQIGEVFFCTHLTKVTRNKVYSNFKTYRTPSFFESLVTLFSCVSFWYPFSASSSSKEGFFTFLVYSLLFNSSILVVTVPVACDASVIVLLMISLRPMVSVMV